MGVTSTLRFLRKLISVTISTLIIFSFTSLSNIESIKTKAKAAVTDSCNSSYSANNLVASPSHGSAFYIDTGITPILDSGFVGYQIANTSSTTMTNYWVKISNFLGGKISLVNNDDQYFRLSDIAPAKNVTAASISNNVATLTSSNHGLSAGDSITVTGINTTFNGTYSISSTTTNTFTYRKTASNTSLTGLSGKVSPTQTAFFMLKASSSTTAVQTHDISIYNMRPDLNGASELFSCRYTFTKVKETIKANSNKVEDNGFSTAAAITLSDSTPELGQSVTITVEGATGNVGNGNAPDYDIFWVTPAAISTWPTRALRLEQTQIIIDKGDNWSTTTDQTVFTNQLAIFNASDTDLISNSGSQYRATYTFKVIGKPNSSIKVVPVAQIASGTQIKHTATDAAGATLDIGISSFTTSYSLDKSATCVSATSGTGDKANYISVPYTLTASSNSATSTTFDEFVDTPASGAIFKTGSARLTDVNNTNVTLSDPTYLTSESALSPQPLHFANKFTVNSSRTAILTYEMWIPKASGTYSNTASIKIGDQTVGKTSSSVPQVQLTTDGTTASTCNSTTTSLTVEATTYPATSIANTTTTLNAIVDPNGVTGQTAEFEYGTSPTLASKTTTTATTPSSGSLTGSDPLETLVGLSGLSTGTKYYFRIKVGSVYGDILSFVTTQPIATPTITTDPPTNVTSSNATLNGTIDPNLTDSSVSFTISSTSSTLASGTTTVRLTDNPAIAPSTTGNPPSNPYTTFSSAFPTQVSINMTDYGMPAIVANTTYYYRVNYLNTSGTLIASGDIKSFTMTNYIDQTITFADLTNKTYGDAAVVTSPTATSNLTVVLTSNTTSVCTVSGFTITIIGAGYCEISANQSGGLNSGTYYNPAPEVIKSFNIEPKNLTVTGSSHSINYGDAAPSPSPSYSAFAYSESASNLITQPTCTTNYVQGDSVGTSRSTTCSGGSSNNYVFIYINGTVTINKKTMRVTASSHTVTYGDSAPVVSPSYNASDFYSSETATAFDTPPTCSTNYVDGDGYNASRSTSCSGGLDNNYNFSYTSGSVTINKASLTITASSPSTINTGDPVPTITASYSGLVNSEDGSVVVTGLVCTTTYTTSSSAGTFPTSCSGGVASNYNIFYTNGSFVANNASLLNQTITFNSISGITYGDSSPVVSPSTNATGLSVTLNSNSTDVCTVLSSSPWTITILKPGTCSITASQPGDTSYNPASDVTRTFNIGTKTLTVISGKVTANNKQYNDNFTAALNIASGALSGIVGSDSVTLNIGSVSPVFVSKNVDTNIVVTYTGLFTLSGTNSTYYTLTQPSLTLNANITKAPLTITASSHTLVAGSSIPTITSSYTGFEGDDDDSQLSGLVCTTTYTTSSSAGTYVTNCSSATSTNYSLIYTDGAVIATTSGSGGGGSGGGGGTTSTPTPTPTPSPTSTRRITPVNPVIRRNQNVNTPVPQPTSTLRTPPTEPSLGNLAINPQTPNNPLGTIENGGGKIIVAPENLSTDLESIKNFIQQFNNSAAAGNSSSNSNSSNVFGSINSDSNSSNNANSTTQFVTTKRNVEELAREKIVGFNPNAGVTIEVVGSRATAQFIVSPTTISDPIVIAAAIKESTARTATDFAKIQSATPVAAPLTTKPLISPIPSKDMIQRFMESDLSNPITVDQLNIPDNSKWLAISASAETYKPGSKVYLAITTQPIIFGEAIVDKYGKAQIVGKLPISALESGAHTVRVVGIRQLSGVSIDNDGEIVLSEKTMQEIQRFDKGTQATVKMSGKNISGGNHFAFREVPLVLIMPWWTIWIVGWTLFIAIVAKLFKKISNKKEKIFSTVVMTASALPALWLGWTRFSYPVMGVGALLAAIGVVCIWLLPAWTQFRKNASAKASFWSFLSPGK